MDETLEQVDMLPDPLHMLDVSRHWVAGVLPLLSRPITTTTDQRAQDEKAARVTSLLHARNMHYAWSAISLLPQSPEPAQALCRVVLENCDRVFYHIMRATDDADVDYDPIILIDRNGKKGLTWTVIDKYLNEHTPAEMQKRIRLYRNNQSRHVHSGELDIYVIPSADDEWVAGPGIPQDTKYHLAAISAVVSAWCAITMTFPDIEAHLSGRNDIDDSVLEEMRHWNVPADWIIKTIDEALVDISYASRIDDI